MLVVGYLTEYRVGGERRGEWSIRDWTTDSMSTRETNLAFTFIMNNSLAVKS